MFCHSPNADRGVEKPTRTCKQFAPTRISTGILFFAISYSDEIYISSLAATRYLVYLISRKWCLGSFRLVIFRFCTMRGCLGLYAFLLREEPISDS